MEYPKNDLRELSFESSQSDITNVVVAYTIEEYIGCFDPHSLSIDRAKTEQEAQLLAHIARTYINKAISSDMCSAAVANWCIWRIENAMQKHWRTIK